LSASQNEQARNAPSPGRQPVAGGRGVGVGAVAEHEAVDDEVALEGRHGPDTRGSTAGRKPTSGMSSRLASSRPLP
jgi:hypothetical protein